MRKSAVACLTLFALSLLAVPSSWGTPPPGAEILLKAHEHGALTPLLSVQYPGMDVPAAYAVQKAYVRKRLTTDTVAGYKAGLTSVAGQKKFGVSAPLAGVLFGSGKQVAGAVVDRSAFNSLMVETEIGMVIGKPISGPIHDLAQLRASIRGFMPVIELPDLGFANMKAVTGIDLIAADVGAAQFITGTEKAGPPPDLNAISVTLAADGKEINRGQGSDTLGDQWQTALWLVNTMTAQGWQIQPGQILITGVLGKMVPGKPGSYVADYGGFGTITFEIK
jgi:2-keto-4-pentenoate hydratase